MSKEDCYSHLGDGASREATDERIADADMDADTGAGADASGPEIRVVIDDGTETITLTVDAEDVSVDDLRDAIRAASDDSGASRTALAPDVRAATVDPAVRERREIARAHRQPGEEEDKRVADHRDDRPEDVPGDHRSAGASGCLDSDRNRTLECQRRSERTDRPDRRSPTARGDRSRRRPEGRAGVEGHVPSSSPLPTVRESSS